MTQDMFPFEEEEYYYCHRVEVHLALSAVYVDRPDDSRFCIHLPSISLPNKELRAGQKSSEVAEQIFQRLTGTTPTWLPIKQVGVIDGNPDKSVVILYAVTMPQLVPLLDESMQWVNFETLTTYPKLLQTVGLACNVYKIGV